MAEDPGRGMPPRDDVSPRDKPDAQRDREAALARDYRHAAAGDAHHERDGGPAPGGQDPTLVPTPEVPDQPLPDVVRPDAADGEVLSDGQSDGGQGLASASDAELAGLEPGEMSGDAEP